MRAVTPYIFNNTIGTTRFQVRYVYDSLFISNDSLNSVFYSVDGQNFQELKPAEFVTFDYFCLSNVFVIYASAASTAVRFNLWFQGGRR